MKHAALLMLLATPAFAADLPPHMQRTWGGWLECQRGYVMRANECVTPDVIAAEKFIVSDLPSAGDGAPGTCPSGGCEQPAPQVVYRDRPYYDGWRYGGENPGGGATFTRNTSGWGNRQVLVVPTWPW